MMVLYVPVLRTAVSYTVSFGRRWSVLEHMLLIELISARCSVEELAVEADLPPRMVVEALINLLRANWIEIRADENRVAFAATAVGARRAVEPELPAQLGRDTRFTSLCFDQVTGTWLRSDDLKLVYKQDLPDNAHVLQPAYHSFDPGDGSFRDLLYLDVDQSLEPDEPRLQTPSRPFARVEIAGGVVSGLPAYASLRLRCALLEHEHSHHDGDRVVVDRNKSGATDVLRDTIGPEDIVVGGDAHLDLVRHTLSEAATAAVIHSCFVHAEVVRKLLPDLETAAKRKVKVELLWGLHKDPESNGPPPPINDAIRVLDSLPSALRSRVQMSSMSSASHAKVLLHDLPDGSWRSAVSSCNFLSSWYDALDLTIRSRSQRLATRLLGWLLTAQLPAAGGWSPSAKRLNRLWAAAHASAAVRVEAGEHELTLMADEDHYACIRLARDEAERRIVIGCDLFGVAAETSAIVPMESAATRGRTVHMFYQRPSKFLVSEGHTPSPEALKQRGIVLEQLDKLHGKLLLWDDDALAASSFNWLSTTADSARTRGAELGLLVRGPDISEHLASRLMCVPGADAIRSALAGRADESGSSSQSSK